MKKKEKDAILSWNKGSVQQLADKCADIRWEPLCSGGNSMKKLISLCLLMLCLFLTGCSEEIPEENTIAVDKKGAVTYTVVEEFGKDFYDVEELRGDIEEEIGNYNRNFGSDPLTLKTLEADQGTIVMQLEFAEAQYYEKYYADYSKAALFVGSIEEAQEAGYDLDGEFLGADGSLTDITQLSNPEKCKVLITNEAISIQVPGEIQCVSPSGSVVILEKKKALVKEDVKQACVIYK